MYRLISLHYHSVFFRPFLVLLLLIFLLLRLHLLAATVPENQMKREYIEPGIMLDLNGGKFAARSVLLLQIEGMVRRQE